MTVFELISLFSRYRKMFNNVEVVQMCGLGKGTTTTMLKTTNPIIYFLYNQELTLNPTDNIAITACTIQPISTFCYYLVSVDINKAVTTTKGVDNTYALPSTPSGNVPIGAFLVTTDALTTFTAGTTDLNWPGVSFFDIDAGMALQLINQAQMRLERGVTIVRKGLDRTVVDFDYMMVRAQVALYQGDATVVLPFPNFKRFVDEGINLTDTTGITTRMDKDDTLPLGVIPIQTRPQKIAQIIKVETSFTLDGYPGTEFDLWPECDQDYTLDVQAYQYSPALDGVIYQRNWLTDNAPDILLFGALMESGFYFGTDTKNKEWEARWQEAVWTLYVSQEKEKYSGSHLHTNFPDPIRSSAGMGLATNKEGILSYGFINS